MAPATLYRFHITTPKTTTPIDVRVALHPSETLLFMITRLLAYALNYEDGIEFGPGLSDPDAPAIKVVGNQGQIAKWIDIGNPSPRRLHKAAKAALSVCVYTYKDVARLKAEAAKEKIYNVNKIQVFAVDSAFLEELAEGLQRDNQWEVSLAADGELKVVTKEDEYLSVLEKHSL
jgi:uncharacterized protein YaeQ